MYNKNSPELFLNLEKKGLPPKNHPEYLAIRDEEKRKCIEGVNINGIHIWGSLYYHLNHHYIDVDELDNRGNTVTVIKRPSFRDNEWIFHEAYNQAYNDKKGLIVGSARQLSKTTTEVSLATRQLFLFPNSEVLGLFSSKPDKQTFTKKLQIALQHNTDFIVIPSIDKDLNKEYIRFGVTRKDNEPYIYSKLYMYLTDGGNASEIGAGKTINFYFSDEVAKAPFIETHEAVIPAINSKFGLRCSPVYTFTGGNVEKSKDAEAMFLKPSTYYMKEFDNEGKKTGLFLSGHYRSDFKDDINFIDWYNKKYNTTLPVTGELSKIDFSATNFERANKKLDEEEELAKQSSLLAYQKRKMYAPRKISDMFLKTESNPFSHLTSEFEKLLIHLEEKNIESKVVDLTGDEKTGVKFNFSTKPVLLDYPVPDSEEWKKDSGLVIMDPPRLQAGTKLYVIGCDPFNMIKAGKSASLGSFYVMRRDTSDYTDPYGGRIVAWYNGRKDITHFRKTLLQTLVLYGGMDGCCTLLHEASDDSLTQWFNEKNLGFLLEDSYSLSKEINPASQVHNIKGMRPTPRTQAYYLSKLLDYCEETMEDGKLGLWRLNDPYVIKQIMLFDGDLGVVDAMAGLGHTIMHYFKERRFKPQIWEKEKPVEKKKNIQNAFGFNINISNFTKKTSII